MGVYMDPSYNNSSNGAGSSGISSGGVGAVGGAPMGGAPVGGNVPAGGSNPMMGAPISSGTGDIVLAPEKKSRKGLIIGLIVGVLIVVGLVAGIFLTRGGGIGGVNMSTEEAFNRYANYLLYGEESDAPLEGRLEDEDVGQNENEDVEQSEDEDLEDNVGIYVLDEVVAEEDATGEEGEILASEFFAKAEQLWKVFYDSLGEQVDADLEDILDAYREDFEFTKIFAETPELNEEVFVMNFATMSRAELNEWLKNHYIQFVDSNYEEIREYGQNGIEYYGLYADYLEQVKMAGCLNDIGEIAIACDGMDTVEMNSRLLELEDEMNAYRNTAIRATTEDCWKIAGILSGEKGEDAE